MLSQKYRPKTLQEVYGNVGTVDGLKNILAKTSKPHTYLFVGNSGCGKTTLARIMATELKCTEVIEINGANNRSIDDVRQIASEAVLSPLSGGNRMYILDECHQITAPAQEALLKVVEECPEFCYFSFCTTEPKKLIKTLKNRCLSFDVSPLTVQQLEDLLANVCKKEDIQPIEGLLNVIAKTSEGSPRRALMSLEKTDGITDSKQIIDMLTAGTDLDTKIWDLCKFMVGNPEIRSKHCGDAVRMLYSIEEDSESMRRAILSYLGKSLLDYSDKETLQDIARVIKCFSSSTYYGGKAVLVTMVVDACYS